MVKQGDTWKDLKAYLSYRKQHLLLEQEKLPFTIREERRRHSAYKQVLGRIKELEVCQKVIDGDIKNMSKYEYEKVQHLKKVKAEKIKGL